MKNSKIIVPHIKNCFTVDFMKKGEVPTEWNLIEIKKIQCDEEENKADARDIGITSLWFELKCGNKNCPAVKRVRATAMANL